MGVFLEGKLFKINEIKKSVDVSKTKSTKKADLTESFADYLRTNVEKNIESVQSTSAMTSADAIFAAQMVDGEEEKLIRKKLVKKGNTLLDSLEEIRQGLLFGEISKDKLIEISRIVKQKNINSRDEKLLEIMQEIELRVEVELTKLIG